MNLNTNYNKYADYIFQYFKDCSVGQGLFLLRSIEPKIRKENKTQEFVISINIVIYNLIENDYLYSDQSNTSMPFIKLSQKGFDYLQGGDLECNMISIENYICIEKNNNTFVELWRIIKR